MPQNMNYPGVYRQEVDNSTYTVIDNSTYCAVMGKARKGPANAKTLINSEGQLIDVFGTPIVYGSYPNISAVDYGIYAGIEQLKETSNLWYVRLCDGTEKYSTIQLSGSPTVSSTASLSASISAASSAYVFSGEAANGNTPTYIKEIRSASMTGNMLFSSIGPGVYGNDIAVHVITMNTSAAGVSATALLGGPCSVDWINSYDDASVVNSVNAKWRKIYKVLVYKKEKFETFDATWWATNYSSPVESFYVSNDVSFVDNVGTSLFVEDVINGNSNYVYVRSNILDGTLPAVTDKAFALIGGQDSTNLSSSVVGNWAAFFGNRDTTPLDVAIDLPRDKDSKSTEYGAINTLIGQRLDVYAVTQVSSLTATDFVSIKTENSNITLSNQSYFGRYAGWNLVYDRYNSSRVWLPNVIYAGSVCARVDRLLTPFEAPAGQDIGAIGAGRQNVEVNPTLGGQLYDLNINTVKFVRGVGNVLWGQKTAQLKKTARDRINVRRGLLQIEKTVERIMNAYMFKGNTAKLREKATTQVNAYLNPLKIAGSIQNYKVVCDSSNNPQSSIDAHILNIDLYIQPTSTVEFILVTTVVTNNSVMFTEGK
jgi:hypothetical protein